MDAPFVEIYEWLVQEIEDRLKIPAFSASQDIGHKMPVCRVQLLTGDSTNQFANARQYQYPFQIDVVDDQHHLVRSLSNAYKVMDIARRITVNDFTVQLLNEPSLSSMVDTSTNQVLNRQVIRVTYTVIEDTAF